MGPDITGADLTEANGTRTVSPKGDVWVFCGRFVEGGVSGVCAAKSAGTLTSGRTKPSKSLVLSLAGKRFYASPARPVVLKFHLSKANLKILKVLRKVRMRGTLAAADASGNATNASFAVTLKAPPTRHR